jgi:hypothetical protein
MRLLAHSPLRVERSLGCVVWTHEIDPKNVMPQTARRHRAGEPQEVVARIDDPLGSRRDPRARAIECCSCPFGLACESEFEGCSPPWKAPWLSQSGGEARIASVRYPHMPSAVEFIDQTAAFGLLGDPAFFYGSCPRKSFARWFAAAISKPRSLPAMIIRMPMAIYLASRSSAYTPPMPGHLPCLRQAAITVS